ncbi:unnamed protein product [Symbiodinium microadriaticum]|nr:unnamed protein product [Symbiodinium microadriaticum]
MLQRWFSYHLSSPGVPSACDKSVAECLARESGLEFEEHSVVTMDGHILGLHRCYLPSLAPTHGRPPLLLMHGLMQDAESFLCGGSKSLAHALAHAGYDVWLGNNRGNKYSQGHVSLPSTDERFWDFCIDDLAHFDVPAIVNYIIRHTAYKKLAYVGFSQGTAQAFAALCRHSELGRRVSIFVALAPAVCSPGLNDPNLAALLHSDHNILNSAFGKGSMLASCEVWRAVLSRSMFASVVERAMLLLFGWRCLNISPTRRVAIFQHAYSFSSVKCVIQWFQIIKSGALGRFLAPHNSCRYCEYTFQRSLESRHPHSPDSGGIAGNQRQDSLSTASASDECFCEKEPFRGQNHYDISSIDCPVAILYGGADKLIDARVAVDKLHKCVYVHEEPLYEHLDMIWADTASTNIFPKVVDLLALYHNT